MQIQPDSAGSSTQLQLPNGREALRFWAWLGCVSFGGPAGQIAIMHEEVVERKRWVDETRFARALNYCMVLPGPEAQQLATYLGWLLHGVWGGLAAGLLFILPGFLLLLGLSIAAVLGGEIAWVRAIFRGFEPAVVAVIFAATWRMAKRGLRVPVAWLLAGGAFAALLFDVPFAAILVVAATVGWLAKLQTAGSHGSIHTVATEPAIAADTIRHATTGTTLKTLLIFAVLWGAVFGLLMWLRGVESVPVQMALFFSKAALLTFGGAYAVLPYVSDYALSVNWITPGQVVAGLALGETTPGPLILVLTYFGFMGGYRSAGNSLSEGLFCGTVTTFFTFLPSFAFILIGAPWIERLRRWGWLNAAMAGISAAVVGVILHLGVTVLYRVWWPDAWTARPVWGDPQAWGPLDFYAVGMSVVCGVALLRFRLSVPIVVLIAGVLGVLRWFIALQIN